MLYLLYHKAALGKSSELQQSYWIIVPSQVNVILRLTHLPPFPEYTMDLCRFPGEYGVVRPVAMEGLVIAMTRVTKYTQGARFLCQNGDCPFSTGRNFFTSLTWYVKWFRTILLSDAPFFLCCYWTFYVGFHHIRVHTPGATESVTVGNNFSCMMCTSPLKEDVKFRVLGGEMDVCTSHEMHFSGI